MGPAEDRPQISTPQGRGHGQAVSSLGQESLSDSFLAFLASAFPLGPEDIAQWQLEQDETASDVIDWLVESGRIDARIGHILLEFRSKQINPQQARNAIEAIQAELERANLAISAAAETSSEGTDWRDNSSQAEAVTEGDDSLVDSSFEGIPLIAPQPPIRTPAGIIDPHSETEVALGAGRKPQSAPSSDTPLPPRQEGRDVTDYEYLYGSRFGKYLICTGIGKGTMGAILLAHHQLLGKPVALKILNPTLANDDAFRERFFSEGRFAANTQHPALVHVFDCDERDGWLYLAMEYVDGMSGLEMIRTAGHLPEQKALRVARRIAEGLAEAHRHGIIHRDVKPGNILFAKSGQVKLTDLGLARTLALRPDDTPVFEHGKVVGTPLYMAPEQSGPEGTYDHRADIYALGGTLYHFLCGSPPFEDRTLGGLLQKHAQTPLTPLTRRGVHISARTSALVTWMLAKDPGERPKSCEEIIAEIDLCLGASPARSAPAPAAEGDRPLRQATPATPMTLGRRITAMLHGGRTSGA